MRQNGVAADLTEQKLIFSDDFSSGQLDRSKWNVRTTGKVVNNEQQAYVDTDETIYVAAAPDETNAENKVLVLHPRHRPGYTTADGQRFDFISGRIDTRDKFDFQYGAAEARVLLPRGAGVWPAFWILGYDRWPGSGEIDVMEYVGETDWVSAGVHGPGYSGESGLVNKFFFSEREDAPSWHTYSVHWAPDSIVFKVDGLVVYRVTRPMVDFFGSWEFDNRKYLILNAALGGTYPYKTNGVQTPYYGLPAATVDLISEEAVKVAVDWVRVWALPDRGQR